MPRGSVQVALAVAAGFLLLLPLLPDRGRAAEEISPQDVVTQLKTALTQVDDEVRDGKFAEAEMGLERFRSLLLEYGSRLVDAAGAVAEQELAEIELFVEEAVSALGDRDPGRIRRAVESIQNELAEIEEAFGGPAGDAGAAARDLIERAEHLAREASGGAWREARELAERLSDALAASRDLLLKATGDAGEKGLAEVDAFLGRLEGALEKQDLDAARRAGDQIVRRLQEIAEALGGQDEGGAK